MYKRLIAIVISIITVISITFSAQAAPTDTYTRVDVQGDETEYRLSHEAYVAKTEISAKTLNLSESLEGITDINSCSDNTVLVLCGEKSRIIRLNSDYTLHSEISVVKKDGTPIDYSGAQGVFSDVNGDIYIADTKNSQIIVTDYNGNLKEIITTPVSSLIPKDFLYQPTEIAKDKQGYMYVLSLGCFYGALLYSPEGEFLGFYGANTVKSGALDTIEYLWDKLTSNDEKKSASIKTLPYSFVDFDFDSEGYFVTCTGNTSDGDNGTGQIRKVSPTGADILYKRRLDGETVSSSSINFLEKDLVISQQRTGNKLAQNMVSVALSDDNYIFGLDRTNGTVYMYDSECNLMAAFGGGLGTGDQLGVFKTPVALTINNNNILVADFGDNSITVFTPTEYGQLLRKAQAMYLEGDYEEAKPLWEKVLSFDRSSQLAYRGLAMVYYNLGDYDAALEAARIAVDYTVYDLAWQAILSRFFADNFVWLLLIAVILIFAIVFFVIRLRKNNRVLIKNIKLKLLFESYLHPFKVFDDLKYRKLGSYRIALVLTVLLYVAFVLKETVSGFLYTDTISRNYNALYTLVATVGLLILWSVCNWLVCSMFSGKGTFKEVYVSTTYSLLPMIVFTFIRTLFTNFLPLSASGLVDGIEVAIVIYTFFLLSVAMMKVHEYDFFKFLLTGIVIIFFMILVVFVILMCSILFAQLCSFVQSIFLEIAYR